MEESAVTMERWLGDHTIPEATWVGFRTQYPQIPDETLLELVERMLDVGRLQPTQGTPVRPDGLPVWVQLPAWRWPIAGHR
jgi:hypothetical protein